LITVLVLLLLFSFLGRYFIRGILAGALKGQGDYPRITRMGGLRRKVGG